MEQVVGIIAEYNPFHNGHAALINMARQAGGTHFVAVMSGNFTQRAKPAICDKRLRAHAALLGGINLVLELPLAAAASTAQHFALESVRLLQATGCVDTLCFGSECGDSELLREVSEILSQSDTAQAMRHYLDMGNTFAKARSMAVENLHGTKLADCLRHPNNLLGVEYMLAARQLHWKPKILTFQRQGAGHHDDTPSGGYASASFVRGLTDMESMLSYLPKATWPVYRKAWESGLYPADEGRLEPMILSRLRMLPPQYLSTLPDLSEGIERRLYKAIRQSVSLHQLEHSLKTKRYTMSRIRRLLLHAFLGVTAKDMATSSPYLRVLGFDSFGQDLLTQMRSTAALPVSASLAKLRALGGDCLRFARLEELATDQFALLLPKPLPCGYEYTASGVFIKEL